MCPDPDCLIGAASLLALYGEDAPMRAAMRAFAALGSNDMTGFEFWQGVMVALEPKTPEFWN